MINRKTKKRTNELSSDEAIVSKCLHSSENLDSMRNHFLKIIETLEDNFLKERICSLAISLLQERSFYERIMKQIKDFAIEKDSIPRSLRTKTIKLVPALPPVVRYQEFMALEEEAAAFHKQWQKGYKNFFRRVREIDRKEALKQLTVNFFEDFLKIVHVKLYHTFVQQSNDFKKLFKNSEEMFQAQVWLNIFKEYKKYTSPSTEISLHTAPNQAVTATNAITPNAISTTQTESLDTVVIDLASSSIPTESNASSLNSNGNEKTTTNQEIDMTTANANPSLSTISNCVATAIHAEANISNKESGMNEENNNENPVVHSLDYLAQYLNMSVDNIKDKILEKFQNIIDSNQSPDLQQGKSDVLNIINKVSNFILSIIPITTTSTIDAYNRKLKKEEADELAIKLLKSDEITTTSKKVAEAISNEATMESPLMQGFINKNIKKGFEKRDRKAAKNVRGGKTVTFQHTPLKSNKKNQQCARKTNSNSNKNHTPSNNKPSKTPPARKRKINQHQQSNSKQQQRTNKKPRENNQQKRKTFKSLKWIRPKKTVGKDRQEE